MNRKICSEKLSSCSPRQSCGNKYLNKRNSNTQRGGSGHLGHTRFDTVYHNRPEYGFYSTDEMIKMNAQVGGCTSKQRKCLNTQRGGSGHLGHTRFDTVYHNRPEYGFYSTDEMVKMNAQVGGCRSNERECIKERSNIQRETMDTHLNRIKGVIENMIDISESPEVDIVEILSNEVNPKTNCKYGECYAQKLLNTYIELNPNKQKKLIKNSNPNTRKYFGGNRVTLPLSFYTGEIPNKLNVSIPTNNYCA